MFGYTRNLSIYGVWVFIKTPLKSSVLTVLIDGDFFTPWFLGLYFAIHLLHCTAAIAYEHLVILVQWAQAPFTVQRQL